MEDEEADRQRLDDRAKRYRGIIYLSPEISYLDGRYLLGIRKVEKKIVTPGFALLATALLTMVGSFLAFLSWKEGLKDNIIVAIFDIITSFTILFTILNLESNVPPCGVISLIPVTLLLDHINVLNIPSYEILGVPIILVIVVIARSIYGIKLLVRAWKLGKGLVLGVDTTLIQLAIVSLLAIFSSASIVYIVEVRDPASPIKSFGDALWWAISTATTVGYGDVVPVTELGRLTASILMVIGIGSLGIFISDMAVRVARILMAEDLENLPVLEREKRKIIKSINEIETLTDEELETLMRKIKVLHLLSRTADEEKFLEILVEPIKGHQHSN